MIPLLLDAGLPRGAAADLRLAGWDVEHVADRGLGTSTDEAILDAAEASERVIVTLDNDFPKLLFLRSAARPSVILLRIEGLTRVRTVSLLASTVPLIETDLRSGAIVSVTEDDLRVRPLPLG